MGSITVFTIDGCPYCKQITTALERWGLPYTEISLSRYPQKRKDLLQLTGKVSVPQLFVRKELIGGADDTLGYFRSLQYNDPEEWDSLTSTSSSYSLLEAPPRRQQSKEASHGAPRLMIPITEGDETDEEDTEGDTEDSSSSSSFRATGGGPVWTGYNSSTTDTIRITAPDGKSMTVLETTEKMKQILQYTKRRWKFTDYKSCCTGREVVDSFVKEYTITRSQAEDFGKLLKRHQILHHVSDGSEFKDSTSKFYRLQCFQTPNVLNSYRIWPQLPVPSDPEAVLRRVLVLFGRVEEAITGHDGYINYRIAYMCSDFVALEDAICELHEVDLSGLRKANMMAFGLNIYNLMRKFSFTKVGVPLTESSRNALVEQLKFNVGGHLFSLQDWLDGILRGNRRSPVCGGRAFQKKDPRLALASNVGDKYANDCRIHFATHCWSTCRRSPPVKWFSADALEEDLMYVALSFCEEDDNVAFRFKQNQMRLADTVRRYRSDFADESKKLAKAILKFLYGPRKARLERAVTYTTAGIKVSWRKEDWALGVSDFVPFDASLLNPNVTNFGKYVRTISKNDAPPGRIKRRKSVERRRSKSPGGGRHRSRSPGLSRLKPIRRLSGDFKVKYF